ncbi:hypothetical protein CASFOL_012342 [Castilleja foliolosa]|uniref:Uncharacterized protein n=1 Tax=Castilleja foliolosa TaxID=1961234 RepID=A0ABD3DU70_9LAMI
MLIESWAIFEVVTTKQIGVGCGGFLNLSTTETDILQNISEGICVCWPFPAVVRRLLGRVYCLLLCRFVNNIFPRSASCIANSDSQYETSSKQPSSRQQFEILHQLRNKIKSKILGREGLFEVIVSSKQLRVDSFNVSRLTIDDEIKDVYIMSNYPAPYESNTSDDSFLQTLNYVEEKDRAVTRGETKDIEAEADSETTHTKKKQKKDELDK